MPTSMFQVQYTRKVGAQVGAAKKKCCPPRLLDFAVLQLLHKESGSRLQAHQRSYLYAMKGLLVALLFLAGAAKNHALAYSPVARHSSFLLVASTRDKPLLRIGQSKLLSAAAGASFIHAPSLSHSRLPSVQRFQHVKRTLEPKHHQTVCCADEGTSRTVEVKRSVVRRVKLRVSARFSIRTLERPRLRPCSYPMRSHTLRNRSYQARQLNLFGDTWLLLPHGAPGFPRHKVLFSNCRVTSSVVAFPIGKLLQLATVSSRSVIPFPDLVRRVSLQV